MKQISDIITINLLKNHVIRQDEFELCRYGLECMLTSVCEIGFVLCLAILMGIFTYTIVFFVAFIPLRIYSGGYHADTRLRCFGILVCVYGLFFLTIKHTNLNITWYLLVLSAIASVICLCLWSPLNHKNKSIIKNERIIYKKISIIICAVENMFIIFMVFINKDSIYVQSFSLGISTAIISLIAGKIKNIVKEADNNE